MVEAPGTAPGSALPISLHVYRHSRTSRHPYHKLCLHNVKAQRLTENTSCALYGYL